MKFVDEYREGEIAGRLAEQIALMTSQPIKLMEVCGGHTHTIFKYGIEDLLPPNIEMIHGPGCPVCVIPLGRVDDAISIALGTGVINTSGIGLIEHQADISVAHAGIGDKVIVSGAIGDHGTTIMIARGELDLETEIESDAAPLNSLVEDMFDEAARLDAAGAIHCLRDPTRGGVATTLNEIALSSEVCLQIEESLLPVREEVKGACEILGFDPLYVANEGKLVALVAPEAAEAVVARMRAHPQGREARIIGEAKAEPRGIVVLRTAFGGTRIVDLLVGEQLPRIC
jgi:hydrogenase expression/formation protein HypE